MLVAIPTSHNCERIQSDWSLRSRHLPISPVSEVIVSHAETVPPLSSPPASPSPIPSPRPLPPLYTDVIHTILHFASFDDLLVITRLNKHWRHSIATLKPRKLHSLHIRDNQWDADSAQRVKYSTSTLLPHISRVVLNIGESQPLARHCERLSLFPGLMSVEGISLKQRSVQLQRGYTAAAHLPSTLTSLQLHAVGLSTRLALVAISEVNSLRILKLHFMQSQSSAGIEFQPLLKLTQLAELTVHCSLSSGGWFDSMEDEVLFDRGSDSDHRTNYNRPNSYLDTSSLVHTVRQMPSLRRLDLGDSLRLSMLEALTLSGYNLHQLEWISPGVDSDQQYVNTLPLLPSLTSVELDGRFTDATFLLQLPHLTSLDLTFLDEDFSPWPDGLVDCLQHLTQLTELSLYYPFLEEHHLHQLFPHLPNLRQLALLRMEFEGLSWVRRLAAQLVRLELWYCDQIDATDYVELFALTRLESLKISESFDDNLAEAELSLFIPCSELFPHLKEFSYQFGEIFVEVSPRGVCVVPPVYQ